MNFLTKTFKKQKLPVVFLDKTSHPNIMSEQKINVILSPSFYWVKRESLPARSVFGAKKLLPFVFEPILPPGNYSYHALKKGDAFDVFAYEDSSIISFLESVGIKTSQIEGIYFAQNEIEQSDRPIQISDEAAMICVGGIWSVVPLRYVQNPSLAADFLGNDLQEKISIDLFKNFVLPQDQLNKVIFSIVALILIFGFDYFFLQKEFGRQMLTQYKIIDEYSLPKTSIELQSLKGELLETQAAQENLRLNIKNLLSLSLADKEKFIRLEAKSGSKIYFEIILKEPKRAEELKSEISSKCRLLSLKVVDSTLRGEIGL